MNLSVTEIKKQSLEKKCWINCRIPCHFGPPHLHVSGGFEDRGITQFKFKNNSVIHQTKLQDRSEFKKTKVKFPHSPILL